MHLYCRTHQDGVFNDTYFPQTDALWLTGKECVHPMASPTSDDKLYIQFMCDSIGEIFLYSYPGSYRITGNHTLLLSPEKQSLVHTGITPSENKTNMVVSQNFPTPAKASTWFTIGLFKTFAVSVEIYSRKAQF